MSLLSWNRREPRKHSVWKRNSGLWVDVGWKVLKISSGEPKLNPDIARIECRGKSGVFFYSNPKQ